METYARLVNDVLEIAPKNGYGYSNFYKSVELMTKYGYKPYKPVEKPNDGLRYSLKYEDKGDYITQVWILVPYTKEDIQSLRAKEYEAMTDGLCSEFTRKSILGTLSPERRLEIQEELDMISKDIAERYPYPPEEN